MLGGGDGGARIGRADLKALTRFELEVTNDLWQIDAMELRSADQHKAYVLD